MHLVITYDLRGEDRDYGPIEGELRRLKARHILESVWLYDGPIGPSAMLSSLLRLIKNDDGLFVAVIGLSAANELFKASSA